MDASFISDETLDQLLTSSQVGKTRIGCIDVNKPRMRAVVSAAAQSRPVYRMGSLWGS